MRKLWLRRLRGEDGFSALTLAGEEELLGEWEFGWLRGLLSVGELWMCFGDVVEPLNGIGDLPAKLYGKTIALGKYPSLSGTTVYRPL